jgi:1-acyl-sn-glycerol-3-phosphate acyltransferase
MAVPPPPPLLSLIADAFVSLSLLALLVAFGRPETTNARALPRTRVVVIVVVAVAVGPPRWALRHAR